MSLLTLQGIRKEYFGRTVLEDIALTLDRGDRLALIGDNGAGKTTLLRLIAGQEQPGAGQMTIAGGAIVAYLPQHLSDGSDWPDRSALISPELTRLEAEMRDLETQMALAPADQQPQLLHRYADCSARFDIAGGYAYRHLMSETLAGLGLAGEILDRPLSSYSGGERMRVVLARLLIRRPDILLLDEPTNHLDLAAIEWLEGVLRSFRGAVLLVSHDRVFIDRCATATAELRGGRITVRPGGYTQFRAIESAEIAAAGHQAHELGKTLRHQQQAAQNLLSHRKMTSFHSRERVVRRLTRELADLRARAARPGQNLRFSFLPPQGADTPDRVLIDARSLAAAYDRRTIFQDLDLMLRGQRKLCLCGPNGCGKSTLLNILLGRQNAAAGELRVSRHVRFAVMDQQPQFAHPERTIEQTLLEQTDGDVEIARDQLARFGFRGVDREKRISVLSGGEKARVFLALLLLEQPDVLFLDEPTNHLDIESREVLEDAIRAFEGAVLAVSHDRWFIDRCMDSVIGFLQGTARLFADFEQYRQAARAVENTSPLVHSVMSGSAASSETDAQSAAAAPANPPLNRAEERINRAEERRREALRRQELSRLERDIAALEEEIAALEAHFQEPGAGTPEEYQRYADAQRELDSKTDQYLSRQD